MRQHLRRLRRALRRPIKVKFAHCSMKFSDSPRQIRHDARLIFGRGYDIITGTEAGAGNDLRTILPEEAEKHGYRIYLGHATDSWVAVRKTLIKGGWKKGTIPVIGHAEGQGRHTNKAIAWVAFDTEELGRITVGASHYLTRGRRPSEPNYDLNHRYGKAIGQWAQEAGAGTALVFYGGDQNIVDKHMDTFFGAPMTSAWDELKTYEGTGHGNIDVIASYDKDGRVRWVSIRSLSDRELFLFTDHFLVEAVAKIKRRPKRRQTCG